MAKSDVTSEPAVQADPEPARRPARIAIARASAPDVEADAVDVHQGAVGRVAAADVAVSQGAIGLARGERVSLEFGGMGMALAREVRISQSGVQTAIARDLNIEQAFVGTSVSATARFERPSAVVFLVARRVEGDIKVLFDWRGALAFGAVFAVLVRLIRRR